MKQLYRNSESLATSVNIDRMIKYDNSKSGLISINASVNNIPLYKTIYIGEYTA